MGHPHRPHRDRRDHAAAEDPRSARATEAGRSGEARQDPAVRGQPAVGDQHRRRRGESGDPLRRGRTRLGDPAGRGQPAGVDPRGRGTGAGHHERLRRHPRRKAGHVVDRHPPARHPRQVRRQRQRQDRRAVRERGTARRGAGVAIRSRSCAHRRRSLVGSRASPRSLTGPHGFELSNCAPTVISLNVRARPRRGRSERPAGRCRPSRPRWGPGRAPVASTHPVAGVPGPRTQGRCLRGSGRKPSTSGSGTTLAGGCPNLFQRY